ncbi:flagellar biosynthetic protein FliQ [Mariniblastus fucicola]|uniref:Flagellar biosynthetic protein FliQ n=1 Tax=Mariniblastus fucicola TaxID=980251 RepID=A0A5B9PF58_9BACT|nr:flagellar biosynthetic protein FliQ [Mariniblastus fucicola]QEG24179.1 Flagellar biosynthetic protein FliQ [Mariniblastus fucicola]
MEPESAIEASREAIKVCFMVGGPILAVCLIVGLLMGLAQAMSHIQDQALATVPKILAIMAVIGLALPWFADRMMDFSKEQFSRPFMAKTASASRTEPVAEHQVESLLAPESTFDESYYPRLDAPPLESSRPSPSRPVATQASFQKQKINPVPGVEKKESPNPFSLPSYRFSRRPSENIEG